MVFMVFRHFRIGQKMTLTPAISFTKRRHLISKKLPGGRCNLATYNP
jgi:hypothetical protein